MKKGLLIILSGPSGVGKGTVRKILMRKRNLNLAYSISMTTRAPRNQEVDGVDYFFVSKEYFEEQLANDKLLEHAHFVKNSYGTPKDYVDKLRNEGKNVILEIETRGARQVMDKLAKDEGLLSIFLNTPSMEELEKRIRGRQTESDEIIKQRLEKAKSEIKLKNLYDFEVINDDPKKAADEIASLIRLKLKCI